MKANRTILAGALALATGMCLAGWESWQKDPGLYGVTFEDYETGETLSDLGATGGTWGDVTKLTGAAARNDGERTYMSYSTSGEGIAFTPDSDGDGKVKSLIMSMNVTGSVQWPDDLSSEAKTAFTVYAPEGEDATFLGWGILPGTTGEARKPGWRRLHLASGQVPSAGSAWYEVSFKFAKKDDGTLRVQHRLNTGHAFEALYNEDGTPWLDVGGDGKEVVRKVAYSGDGGLEYMTGSEPMRGLLVGIAPWYSILYDESTYNEDPNSSWANKPEVGGDGDYFVIDVGEGQDPSIFIPASHKTGVELIEAEVQFYGANVDASVPDGMCARVRLVEVPMTDTKKEDPSYQFACLANGAWVTNTVEEAFIGVDYTIEITLDSIDHEVTYRARKGRGGSGGAFRTICTGSIPEDTRGRDAEVYFEGCGRVYKVRGTDRTKQP